jgi:prenyltransferase beta subunit
MREIDMKKHNRRAFLSHATGIGLGISGLPILALAQKEELDPELTAIDVISKQTQVSIDKGLKFLAGRQNEDGSFGDGGYSRNVAICGLAGMAFMASGSTPGRGPYGDNVSRCVEYILANAHENGFIMAEGTASHGPMYGHGFATMFLAEVYGMSPDTRVREQLVAAVRLIVETQNADGGWRYQPERSEADLSVTVCQIMALRAARNAGVYVSNEVVEQCKDYVKRSQNADGGFMYMIMGGESAFPRSAAGVVALYSAGIYEGEEIEKGLDYLMQFLPRSKTPSRQSHYFYGQYYAVQTMWHAGGKRWQRWYPAIRDALVEQQVDDGHWRDSICNEYGTAMACIILQMPNNYLPIFQR